MSAPLLINSDGVARCARYAFGPNKLHLCGPDANQEVLAYLQAGVVDPGLTGLLSRFGTLYPYLLHIARANNIADPFNERVVEAYWIGNELLESIPLKIFYNHLVESLHLKKRSKPKEFDRLVAKLPLGASMHHSFHVFNVYERTGHDQNLHTVASMDACRISWGRVVEVNGSQIKLMRQPLKINNNKLYLAAAEPYVISRRLEDDFMETPKLGDLITMHWQVPCEIVKEKQVRWLDKFTLKHLDLANSTI